MCPYVRCNVPEPGHCLPQVIRTLFVITQPLRRVGLADSLWG